MQRGESGSITKALKATGRDPKYSAPPGFHNLPSSASWRAFSPEDEKALQRIAKAHGLDRSGIGGRTVGDVKTMIRTTPGAAALVAKSLGQDIAHVPKGAVLSAKGVYTGKPDPYKGNLFNKVVLPMAKGVVQDIKHPLRHPGFTALDILTAAQLGAGALGKGSELSRPVPRHAMRTAEERASILTIKPSGFVPPYSTEAKAPQHVIDAINRVGFPKIHPTEQASFMRAARNAADELNHPPNARPSSGGSDNAGEHAPGGMVGSAARKQELIQMINDQNITGRSESNFVGASRDSKEHFIRNVLFPERAIGKNASGQEVQLNNMTGKPTEQWIREHVDPGAEAHGIEDVQLLKGPVMDTRNQKGFLGALGPRSAREQFGHLKVGSDYPSMDSISGMFPDIGVRTPGHRTWLDSVQPNTPDKPYRIGRLALSPEEFVQKMKEMGSTDADIISKLNREDSVAARLHDLKLIHPDLRHSSNMMGEAVPRSELPHNIQPPYLPNSEQWFFLDKKKMFNDYPTQAEDFAKNVNDRVPGNNMRGLHAVLKAGRYVVEDTPNNYGGILRAELPSTETRLPFDRSLPPALSKAQYHAQQYGYWPDVGFRKPKPDDPVTRIGEEYATKVWKFSKSDLGKAFPEGIRKHLEQTAAKENISLSRLVKQMQRDITYFRQRDRMLGKAGISLPEDTSPTALTKMIFDNNEHRDSFEHNGLMTGPEYMKHSFSNEFRSSETQAKMAKILRDYRNRRN